MERQTDKRAIKVAAGSEPGEAGKDDLVSAGTAPLGELNEEQLHSISRAVPGGLANVQDVYPLTPLQEGLLFHHLLDKRNDAYVLSILLELQSSVQRDALIRALQAVIDRHDVLRTALCWEELPKPVQIVSRVARLPVESLASDEACDPISQLKERIQRVRQSWNLGKAPLIRLTVSADPRSGTHYALLQLHHVICDYGSLQAVVSEVVAHLNGRGGGLAEPGAYRDHVKKVLENVKADEAERFFRTKLGAVDEPTGAFGLQEVNPDCTQFSESRWELESALGERLRAQARKMGVTAARIFHAIWALVVSRTSGRDDVVFGTVLLAAWQRKARVHRTLGMSINTLPLRVRLEDRSAAKLVHHVDKELTEILEYAEVPLVTAQRCSGISASVPLFGTLLSFRHGATDPSAAWSQAQGIRVIATSEARTNYPVTVIVDDRGESFALTAQTDGGVESERVLNYLITAIESFVDALERQLQTPACTLSVLPDSERQVMALFNATARCYPREKLVHQLVEEQVDRSPDATAVVHERRSLSYAELGRRASQLAGVLRKYGVGPDELVGICVERSLEMVIGLFGILKAGGAYIPLDPAYPADRLAYMLSDANPKVLLVQERFKEKLSTVGAKLIALDRDLSSIECRDESHLKIEQNSQYPGQLAYVIYTSGSTGQPKGAMNEHRALVNRLLWMQERYQMTSGDLVLQKTPYSFDVSVWEFFWTLMSGATLVMARPEGHKDPTYLRNLIQENGITRLHFVPAMLQSFLDQLRPGECPSVRHVVCSGEELPVPLEERFFNLLPAADLSNLYGPTEAAIDVTSWECHRSDRVRVPIGCPIANIRMYVLDGYSQPVPIGVVGDIYIGGVGVGRGYLNRPDLTADRFVPDPFALETPERIYKTGDKGRWRSDGALEYLGRSDHQIKIRGFRIELGEIEAQLNLHPEVREALVVVREDVPGDKRLVAYFTCRNQPTTGGPPTERLRAHLKAALPEHMVPAAFVLLESMPLSPNGKLDRRALPSPDPGTYLRRQYEAPKCEVEVALAGVWEELLRVEHIGRHDNFFELGGHSLLAVQMLERLRRVGLTAEVRHVFDSPTLADFARTLTLGPDGQVAAPPNMIPFGSNSISPNMLSMVELSVEHIERIIRSVQGGAANIQDVYPLAPLQEGILFHHLLNERGGDAYVASTLLSVASRERLEELIVGVQHVIDRHDSLRTAVLWHQLPQPVQVVYRRADLPIEEVKLVQDLEPAEQARQWVQADDRQRIDLQHAPMIRLRMAADPHTPRWYVLLQLHHIVCDNTSREIVLSEIVACLEHRAERLPEPLPYRNHVWQALMSARMHDSETVFRNKFGDIDEPTAPFGLTDIYGDGTRIEEAQREVEPMLARRVRARARSLGVSAATLFHAAWGLVVAHTSGRDDVVFGSVLLGRLQGSAGAQRIVGMFINTLPLRLHLKGISARQLVMRTHRELVDLLAHEQASLAAAQRCSGIGGSAPLFSALLNYRHSAAKLEEEWTDGIQLMSAQVRTNYPITVSVDDLGQEFSVTAQTDRRVDPNRVAAYLHRSVESLVDALETGSEKEALELSILPEPEHRHIIEVLNATHVPYPQERTVHELWEIQVLLSPDTSAAVHHERAITYSQINKMANQLARYLRSQGVGPDDIVGILVERSLEMVIALLAILKAGGAYLPLDPNYPTERLRFMVKDSAPRMILTQQELTDVFRPEAQARVIELGEALILAGKYDDGNLSGWGFTAQHAVYLIYTSGSTGLPKGTAMAHRSMVNLLEWHRTSLGCSEGKRVLQFAALSFDVAFQEIFTTLCFGGTLMLVDEAIRRDAQALAVFLGSHSIERLFVPPLMLQGLAEHAVATGEAPSALQDVITAGEQLRISPEIVRFFKHCAGCRLHNHYGPTETHVVTAQTLRGDPDNWPVLPAIGRPISNTQIYVLDKQQKPVPIGVTGEIYIGGAGLATGYLGKPELTAQRFVGDPFSKELGTRVYRTGDLGRWRTDGLLEYLGRNDQQVKLRGYRIELGEIEAQLAKHERVRDVAVLVREDLPGQKRLVAYVSSDGEPFVNGEELRAHLKALLPDHMVPNVFVALDQLPTTPSGKLDRRALPAPEHGANLTSHYEAPQGLVEKTLARVWQVVLGVDPIGRNDNFFDLGGHSLLALKVLIRINQTLGRGVTVTDIYKYPTIQELAIRIGGLSTEDQVVELSREAMLPSDIVGRVDIVRAPTEAVFLTGATGFVGRFLLAQLLQDTEAAIYCLVRAQSKGEAATRLKTTLVKWNLWRAEFENRIVAIPGDLRQPRLGIDERTYLDLCRKVDQIYDCATSMNHLEPYSTAKLTNVAAAKAILELATTRKAKLVNYVSTLGTFSASTTDRTRVIDEMTPIDSEVHWNSMGYVASKWVSEKLFMIAAERAVPVNIFRLGLVWADSRKGRFDELQHVYRLIKSCLLSGYGIRQYRYDMAPTPVDYVAQALVYLGKRHPDGHGIFHIASPEPMIEGVFEHCNDLIGTSLQLLSMYDWICEIKKLHYEGRSLPIVPLLEFAFALDRDSFHEHQRRTSFTRLRFNCARTQIELEEGGIVASSLNEHLLKLCMEDMVSRDVELHWIPELKETRGLMKGSYA